MADVEHTVKVFPIDLNLQENVQELVSDGWNLVPGILPIAVYHLVREKRPSVGAVGRLKIDDSQIHIIPASDAKKQ